MIKHIFLIFAFLNVQAKTKKIYIYKKSTQIDFSEQIVKGKIKTPEIFYIFQRKRSEGHQVLSQPKKLTHHKKNTVKILKEYLK